MKVIVLPSKNSNNLYIKLLQDSVEKQGVDLVVPERDTVWSSFLKFSDKGVAKEAKVLHIQWPTIVYGSRYFMKSIMRLVINFSLILILKKFFAVRVIWTIHNNYAHGEQNSTADRLGSRIMFMVSDGIIAQQQSTLRDLKQKYPQKDVYFIPHGNYIGAYGSLSEDKDSIRRFWGFKEDDVVLLSLGAVKRYKLNERLIEAVISLSKNYSKIKLVIIGKSDGEYIEELKKRIGSNRNIILVNDFVPNESIPQILANCDYSVFYYDKSELTSGGIILSLSYGKPVITRNIAGAEMIDDTCGYRFDNYEGLCEILKDISTERKIWNTDTIIRKVSSQGWEVVARDLIFVYSGVRPRDSVSSIYGARVKSEQ